MYLSSSSLETIPLLQSDKRLKFVQSKTALEVERLNSKSYILRPTPLPRPSLALPHVSTKVEHDPLSPPHFTPVDEQVFHYNSTLPRPHSDH
ncbi:hypothetical protein K443DRAFT_65203, partial [Laccaria amethystina LaAM-08-1]